MTPHPDRAAASGTGPDAANGARAQVEIGEQFAGTFLGVVDAKSRASLPASIRMAVEKRSLVAQAPGAPALDRIIFLDEHPTLDCLRGYDLVFQATFVKRIYDDVVRRAPDDLLAAFDRAQSDSLGDVSDVGYDPSGRFVLPSSLRKYAAIDLGGSALFRGAGEMFEVWSPDRYRATYHADAKRMRKLDDLLEKAGRA